jgi:hypothetical protein
MPSLPLPRGDASAFVLERLRRDAARAAAVALVAPPDPLADDDLQLALYSLLRAALPRPAGVDERWEWEPSLLAFRAALERTFEDGAARELGGPRAGGAARDDGPRAARDRGRRRRARRCRATSSATARSSRCSSSSSTARPTSSRRPTRTRGRSRGSTARPRRRSSRSRPTSTAAGARARARRALRGAWRPLGLDRTVRRLPRPRARRRPSRP